MVEILSFWSSGMALAEFDVLENAAYAKIMLPEVFFLYFLIIKQIFKMRTILQQINEYI
jgi:hypothetical protein